MQVFADGDVSLTIVKLTQFQEIDDFFPFVSPSKNIRFFATWDDDKTKSWVITRKGHHEFIFIIII